MEGEIKNLINVWSSIIASLCYSYFVSSSIPKGKYRLLSLLPIFYLFTILPLYLSSAFNTALITFFITWLANFKLLLFSFGHGPLSWSKPKSLLLFISIASLPIKIKSDPSPQNQRSPKKVPLNLATEILVFGILTTIWYDFKERIHPKLLLVLYCVLVFLMIDILIAFSNAIVRALVGLELEPPSNEPYLSTSLQDFWGRRWNLMVTNILRHTVYKPVRSTLVAFVGNDPAALLAAVLATFLVSGLMHELLFYNVTRAAPSWEMTWFFVIHGMCVAVEAAAKRALAGRWRLPWFVAGPLTVGFVVATSFWLFFPPIVRNGADVKVMEEFRDSALFLKTKLRF
ncbi:hypothetical protein RJ639_037271 [Escallonia herrerae]|uniref:Wax synthase domain-containing protein n=1 Tax=Escallonia herrerae TaxID=1293975 RepID=A0AA89B9X7_9ASTE|nr:hypothetical protein RJ639_037271 [Escallonia herrerae]